METKNYINQLNELNKQEAEVELNNFYTFNSGLLQFFKAIDDQFISLLQSPNLNSNSVGTILNEVNKIIPDLNNLKFEISMFDEIMLSNTYRNDVLKTIKYIKDMMVISEVEFINQKFNKILKDNEAKFREEQEKQQKEIEEQKKEEKERIESERQEKERILFEKLKKEKEEVIRKNGDLFRELLDRNYSKGAKYIGIKIDGMPNGHGKIYYENGDLAEEGKFKDGKLNGKGKRYSNGRLTEEGEFKDGKLNGKGIRYFYGFRGKEEGEYINGLLKG
jgi:antitoxin component YwqK of YwqJK toxin-antitoxin module